MPKLSVIIPAHNEEATIVPVLESVNAQRIDGVEMEVVVTDDGSTDATGALLEENDSLYRTLIRLPSNRGKGRR